MATIATTLEIERQQRRRRKLATCIRILDAIIMIAVGALVGIATVLVAVDISFLF